MIVLLLGPDDFSKNEYIEGLAKKFKIRPTVFNDAEQNLPNITELGQQDLFSGKKLFVLKNIFSKLNLEQGIENLISSQNQIIIVEEKLDKRVKFNKEFLARKDIEIKEFILPHGKELDKWIADKIKNLGGKISKEAIELLSIKLGRDEAVETKFGGKVVEVKEIFNLWQVDSEIRKLISFAGNREIGPDDVENLVSQQTDTDVLKIVNAIGDGNKTQALNLIQNFLQAENSSDDKAGIIQLNALLSQQFRSVAIVQDFLKNKFSESVILEKTSWKSGRLFIMKKIASRFQPTKVLDFLNKLEHLDLELKTSSTPPKVLLDMILAQLF